MKESKKGPLFRATSFFLLLSCSFTFVVPPQFSYAQSLSLPPAGARLPLSSGFAPVLIKGIKIHPENPLQFDFIVDQGDSRVNPEELKKEAEKLVKYFLATLTTPKKDLWVNLSPYEKDRVIPEEFGVTEMGRDLLAQDYLLKQLTASLVYPEDDLGRKFWARVKKLAKEKYGTADIPMETFNKVWIVPGETLIYENEDTAFVVKNRLKVMMEEDYVAQQEAGSKKQEVKNAVSGQRSSSSISSLSTEIIRELILPEIEREVNEGKNFATLRQIHNSLLLGLWFKNALKESLLGQVYVDRNKMAGVDVEDKQAKEKIYQQYLEAYKKGVYNYIKEDFDPQSQRTIPKKYFSGGYQVHSLAANLPASSDPAMVAPLIQGPDANVSVLGVKLAETRTEVQNIIDGLPPSVNDNEVADPFQQTDAAVLTVVQEVIFTVDMEAGNFNDLRDVAGRKVIPERILEIRFPDGAGTRTIYREKNESGKNFLSRVSKVMAQRVSPGQTIRMFGETKPIVSVEEKVWEIVSGFVKDIKSFKTENLDRRKNLKKLRFWQRVEDSMNPDHTFARLGLDSESVGSLYTNLETEFSLPWGWLDNIANSQATVREVSKAVEEGVIFFTLLVHGLLEAFPLLGTEQVGQLVKLASSNGVDAEREFYLYLRRVMRNVKLIELKRRAEQSSYEALEKEFRDPVLPASRGAFFALNYLKSRSEDELEALDQFLANLPADIPVAGQRNGLNIIREFIAVWHDPVHRKTGAKIFMDTDTLGAVEKLRQDSSRLNALAQNLARVNSEADPAIVGSGDAAMTAEIHASLETAIAAARAKLFMETFVETGEKDVERKSNIEQVKRLIEILENELRKLMDVPVPISVSSSDYQETLAIVQQLNTLLNELGSNFEAFLNHVQGLHAAQKIDSQGKSLRMFSVQPMVEGDTIIIPLTNWRGQYEQLRVRFDLKRERIEEISFYVRSREKGDFSHVWTFEGKEVMGLRFNVDEETWQIAVPDNSQISERLRTIEGRKFRILSETNFTQQSDPAMVMGRAILERLDAIAAVLEGILKNHKSEVDHYDVRLREVIERTWLSVNHDRRQIGDYLQQSNIKMWQLWDILQSLSDDYKRINQIAIDNPGMSADFSKSLIELKSKFRSLYNLDVPFGESSAEEILADVLKAFAYGFNLPPLETGKIKADTTFKNLIELRGVSKESISTILSKIAKQHGLPENELSNLNVPETTLNQIAAAIHRLLQGLSSYHFEIARRKAAIQYIRGNLWSQYSLQGDSVTAYLIKLLGPDAIKHQVAMKDLAGLWFYDEEKKQLIETLLNFEGGVNPDGTYKAELDRRHRAIQYFIKKTLPNLKRFKEGRFRGLTLEMIGERLTEQLKSLVDEKEEISFLRTNLKSRLGLTEAVLSEIFENFKNFKLDSADAAMTSGLNWGVLLLSAAMMGPPDPGLSSAPSELLPPMSSAATSASVPSFQAETGGGVNRDHLKRALSTITEARAGNSERNDRGGDTIVKETTFHVKTVVESGKEGLLVIGTDPYRVTVVTRSPGTDWGAWAHVLDRTATVFVFDTKNDRILRIQRLNPGDTIENISFTSGRIVRVRIKNAKGTSRDMLLGADRAMASILLAEGLLQVPEVAAHFRIQYLDPKDGEVVEALAALIREINKSSADPYYRLRDTTIERRFITQQPVVAGVKDLGPLGARNLAEIVSSRLKSLKVQSTDPAMGTPRIIDLGSIKNGDDLIAKLRKETELILTRSQVSQIESELALSESVIVTFRDAQVVYPTLGSDPLLILRDWHTDERVAVINLRKFDRMLVDRLYTDISGPFLAVLSRSDDPVRGPLEIYNLTADDPLDRPLELDQYLTSGNIDDVQALKSVHLDWDPVARVLKVLSIYDKVLATFDFTSLFPAGDKGMVSDDYEGDLARQVEEAQEAYMDRMQNLGAAGLALSGGNASMLTNRQIKKFKIAVNKAVALKDLERLQDLLAQIQRLSETVDARVEEIIRQLGDPEDTNPRLLKELQREKGRLAPRLNRLQGLKAELLEEIQHLMTVARADKATADKAINPALDSDPAMGAVGELAQVLGRAKLFIETLGSPIERAGKRREIGQIERLIKILETELKELLKIPFPISVDSVGYRETAARVRQLNELLDKVSGADQMSADDYKGVLHIAGGQGPLSPRNIAHWLGQAADHLSFLLLQSDRLGRGQTLVERVRDNLSRITLKMRLTEEPLSDELSAQVRQDVLLAYGIINTVKIQLRRWSEKDSSLEERVLNNILVYLENAFRSDRQEEGEEDEPVPFRYIGEEYEDPAGLVDDSTASENVVFWLSEAWAGISALLSLSDVKRTRDELKAIQAELEMIIAKIAGKSLLDAKDKKELQGLVEQRLPVLKFPGRNSSIEGTRRQIEEALINAGKEKDITRNVFLRRMRTVNERYSGAMLFGKHSVAGRLILESSGRWTSFFLEHSGVEGVFPRRTFIILPGNHIELAGGKPLTDSKPAQDDTQQQVSVQYQVSPAFAKRLSETQIPQNLIFMEENKVFNIVFKVNAAISDPADAAQTVELKDSKQKTIVRAKQLRLINAMLETMQKRFEEAVADPKRFHDMTNGSNGQEISRIGPLKKNPDHFIWMLTQQPDQVGDETVLREILQELFNHLEKVPQILGVGYFDFPDNAELKVWGAVVKSASDREAFKYIMDYLAERKGALEKDDPALLSMNMPGFADMEMEIVEKFDDAPYTEITVRRKNADQRIAAVINLSGWHEETLLQAFRATSDSVPILSGDLSGSVDRGAMIMAQAEINIALDKFVADFIVDTKQEVPVKFVMKDQNIDITINPEKVIKRDLEFAAQIVRAVLQEVKKVDRILYGDDKTIMAKRDGSVPREGSISGDRSMVVFESLSRVQEAEAALDEDGKQAIDAVSLEDALVVVDWVRHDRRRPFPVVVALRIADYFSDPVSIYNPELSEWPIEITRPLFEETTRVLSAAKLQYGENPVIAELITKGIENLSGIINSPIWGDRIDVEEDDAALVVDLVEGLIRHLQHKGWRIGSSIPLQNSGRKIKIGRLNISLLPERHGPGEEPTWSVVFYEGETGQAGASLKITRWGLNSQLFNYNGNKKVSGEIDVRFKQPLLNFAAADGLIYAVVKDEAAAQWKDKISEIKDMEDLLPIQVISFTEAKQRRNQLTFMKPLETDSTTAEDPAQTIAKDDLYGGIAFDASELNIKRDGKGVALPVELQDAAMIADRLQGLHPVIIYMAPAQLPLWLGLVTEEDEEPAKRDAELNIQPGVPVRQKAMYSRAVN